jgi:hypothetical protein
MGYIMLSWVPHLAIESNQIKSNKKCREAALMSFDGSWEDWDLVKNS